MSDRAFQFRVECMRSHVVCELGGSAATLPAAWDCAVKLGNLPKPDDLRLYRFRIRNVHGEYAEFIGQGCDMREAFSDGLKNVNTQFRPKNDGKQRPNNGLKCELPSGLIVTRQVEPFQSDKPFNPREEMTVIEINELAAHLEHDAAVQAEIATRVVGDAKQQFAAKADRLAKWVKSLRALAKEMEAKP